MCWVIDYPFSLLFLLFRWLVKDKWLELWTGWAKEHSTVDHLKVGRGESMRGTGKLHSTKSFRLIFFFFFFFHNIVVLSSTYDVDFMIWFLKRWYFFQEKQKKIKPLWMSFFLSLENLRVCYIPMFFHLKFTLPIKYSILGFFMFYCFSTLQRFNWTFSHTLGCKAA